jgi:hypothetical protein
MIPWDAGISVPSTNITTTITMTIASPIAGPLWNPRLVRLYACAAALFCQFWRKPIFPDSMPKRQSPGLTCPSSCAEYAMHLPGCTWGGVVVGGEDPRRCVSCGRVPLLLLVFADGLVQRARHGCTCFSVPLYRDEAEQVIRERHVSTARDDTGVAKRPAS